MQATFYVVKKGHFQQKSVISLLKMLRTKKGDMGEDKEKDLTEEQRTPSESVGRTYKSLEEEQKSEKTY